MAKLNKFMSKSDLPLTWVFDDAGEPLLSQWVVWKMLDG